MPVEAFAQTFKMEKTHEKGSAIFELTGPDRQGIKDSISMLKKGIIDQHRLEQLHVSIRRKVGTKYYDYDLQRFADYAKNFGGMKAGEKTTAADNPFQAAGVLGEGNSKLGSGGYKGRTLGSGSAKLGSGGTTGRTLGSGKSKLANGGASGRVLGEGSSKLGSGGYKGRELGPTADEKRILANLEAAKKKRKGPTI